MAWRSGGSSNSELCNNLVANGLITCPYIERAFRKVDRKIFVPKEEMSIAYSDQPLKEGNIHISAPHIYCSVLEGLELVPNSSLSFLNIGCGTGYLSCIVASILGHKSPHFGVDIHEDVLQHCKSSISQWKNPISSTQKHSVDDDMMHDGDNTNSDPDKHKHRDFNMTFIHGNGLNIAPHKGESVVGFDRIYVGAALEEEELPKIRNLLGPGGVLVAPIEDDLVKITRIGEKPTSVTTTPNSQTLDVSGDDDDDDAADFTTQIISCVRFAPLLATPQMDTIISSTVWDLSTHYLFPQSFQESSRTLLLCSNADQVQPPPKLADRLNLAGSLPKEIWIHILSFTNRNWFTPEKNHTASLKRKVAQLEEQTSHMRQDLMLMEARYSSLEHERDMYRQIARQCHTYMQQIMSHQQGDGDAITASRQDNVSSDIGMEEAPLLSAMQSYMSGLHSFAQQPPTNNTHEPSDIDNNNDEDDGDSDYSFGEDSMMDPDDDDMLSVEEEEASIEEHHMQGPEQNSEDDNDDVVVSSLNLVEAHTPHSRTSHHNHAMTSNVLNSETGNSQKVVHSRQSRVISISGDDL